ncbi:MAG: glycosyltransferase [Lachnospiraceae bacterium]|nr:glycosyltransferase [Lachnospiraceae bacterium]
MRVLWIADGCSLQDVGNNSCLRSRYEWAFSEYATDVNLALAYAADGKHDDRIVQNGITYYAVHSDMSIGITEEQWEQAKAELLQIIDEFKPDIIQCFGAEWPYGRIVEATPVPVVIHMMGFLNIYYMSIDMVYGRACNDKYKEEKKESLRTRVRKKLSEIIGKPVPDMPFVRPEVPRAESERCVMAVNRYFHGRTEWDRNIVKYYSPGAEYFHVEEIVKLSMYAAAGTWKPCRDGKLRLFTCSAGDDRKGNDIILRTAKILKELMNIDFEWKVAGSREFFAMFEERTGIRGSDVNVESIGYVDDSIIIQELSKADFFIHPSIIDNSPHSVCEAQLIGCPVISSNVGGLPQLVSDGETGWLYPYNEPHTLAFLIGNLRENMELLEAVSRRETEIALKRHDPKKITGKLIEVYERICSNKYVPAK